MTETNTQYRYHPESTDIAALCKQFEDRLPTAKFSHSTVSEAITGRKLLKIEAWNESQSRYYAQVLRNTQEPEDIVERFYESLRPDIKPNLNR